MLSPPPTSKEQTPASPAAQSPPASNNPVGESSEQDTTSTIETTTNTEATANAEATAETEAPAKAETTAETEANAKNEATETVINPLARRTTKSEMEYLKYIADWISHVEGGPVKSYTRGASRRARKKTLEEQMLEDEQKAAEIRRQKREAQRIKMEAEAKKKREEEERIRKEQERIRKEEKAKKEKLLALKRKQHEDEKSKRAKKRKVSGLSTPKSESPETDDLLEQRKTSQKGKYVDDYIPFFYVENDVEISINPDFFIKEIHENTTASITDLEFKSAATLVKESPARKYKNYKGLEPRTITLQSVIFPNISEEYYLMESQDLQLDPLEEIGRLIELTARNFIPDEYKLQAYNPQDPYNSIAGRYAKAFRSKDYKTALEIIEEYNALIKSIHAKDGEIPKFLQKKTTISRLALHELLNQIYSRSVSPNVGILRRYKGFSSNVYGELMPKFLSEVFDQVGLNSKSKFIDLGSGVGNVTIQAALEFGCESYGCEMMENCSLLGDLHAIAFEERCKYFGLNPGKVKLFNNQSFVDNKDVKEVIDQCDVILVNNFLFGPELNEQVMKLFNNLKTGTKIISLKTIIPDSHIIDFNDIENYVNKFDIKKFNFGEGCVSWTSRGGQFYISEFTGLINERALTVFNTRSKDKRPPRGLALLPRRFDH